ncbi:hypothetical protein HDV06_001930 [Boothiomyces sp. JEL0866]|nr:hypothetical protein HDV06_001930 [Boothiomyces sp. JEL0866]
MTRTGRNRHIKIVAQEYIAPEQENVFFCMLLIPLLLNLLLASTIIQPFQEKSLNKRLFGIGERIHDRIQQIFGQGDDNSSSDGSDNSQGGDDSGQSSDGTANTSTPAANSGSSNDDNSNNVPPAGNDDSGDNTQTNNNAPVVVAPKPIPPPPKPIAVPPVTTVAVKVVPATTTATTTVQPTQTIISIVNTDQNIPTQPNRPVSPAAQVIIKANNLPDDSSVTDLPQVTTTPVVQVNATTSSSSSLQPTTLSQSSSSSKTSNGLPRPVTIVAFIIGGVFASCIALFFGLHLKKYGHLNFLHKYYPEDPTSSEKDLTLQSMEEPIDIISDPSDKVPFETREEINRYSEQDMDESFPAFPASALTAAEPELPGPRMSYLITPSSRTSTLPYSGRDSKLTFSRGSTQERDSKLRSLRTSLAQRQSVQSSVGRKSKFMVDSVIPEDSNGKDTPGGESGDKPYRISMFNSRFSRFSFRNSKYTSGAISEANQRGQRDSTTSVDSEESLSNYL